ncbi:hypothetical protein [Nocardioides sp.]|uniref:hypothetical protein n=1 Tax=Nocardioides sp. TaxID=35761 RepID=UPI002CDD13C7|nr:hypothetical protein [Nocardioides sp.]HXH80667.1 hypothetical protein [Nocardioides sp.]
MQVLVAASLVVLVIGAALFADLVSVDVTHVSDLTRDATAVVGVPWWTGVISRLTALGWVVAAVAAVDAGRHAPTEQRSRLLFLGGLCGVSALDDSLMLHEEVLPSMGLPETPFLVLYAVAGLGLAVMWSRARRWTPVEIAFVSGMVMMAVSVLVDVVVNRAAVEDFAKLIGVVAWCFCGVWAHEDVAREPVLFPSQTSRLSPRRNAENRDR